MKSSTKTKAKDDKTPAQKRAQAKNYQARAMKAWDTRRRNAKKAARASARSR